VHFVLTVRLRLHADVTCGHAASPSNAPSHSGAAWGPRGSGVQRGAWRPNTTRPHARAGNAPWGSCGHSEPGTRSGKRQ
jgi:hypothetical protein